MRKKERRPAVILMAEDDPDDRMLTEEAMVEANDNYDLRFVEDGEELLDYLCFRDGYHNREQAPRPDLILLDLNMPRKDGREALQDIKSDPALRAIPVVVLTTSKAEEDVVRSYELGVSGYITKPVRFEKLVEVMKTIGKYWFEMVELPS